MADSAPYDTRSTDNKVIDLEYRVGGIEKTVATIDHKVEEGFKTIGTALTALNGKGTNWQLILSFLGFLFIFATGIGTIVYQPLVAGQTRTDAALQRAIDGSQAGINGANAISAANAKALAESLEKIVDKIDLRLDGKATKETVADLTKRVDAQASKESVVELTHRVDANGDKIDLQLQNKISKADFEAWSREDEKRREDWHAGMTKRVDIQGDAIRHLQETTLTAHDLDALFAHIQHDLDRIDHKVESLEGRLK